MNGIVITAHMTHLKNIILLLLGGGFAGGKPAEKILDNFSQSLTLT